MSDKPKAFEEFFKQDMRSGLTGGNDDKTVIQFMNSRKEMLSQYWNAAIESIQEEIDKRDALLKVLLKRGTIYTYTNGKMEYVLSEELFQVCDSEFKELNGVKDE